MTPYSILDSGAVANPMVVNTVAIQAAIDTCSAHGGGSVLVPPGEFVTGTLYLKDHVNLRLAAGAILKGSPKLADYNADDAFPQNVVFKEENVTGAHLLVALEAKNVSITGLGRIDGNGSAFFGPETAEDKFVIKTPRPGQMVYFVECENVVVSGVELINTPYWSLCFHGCENVRAQGLKITNPRATHNGDGIDIDSCRNVTVSDCLIDAGDDGITLRACGGSLKRRDRACENVTITNCVLATFWNAIRVGVGNGTIRNCVISNLVIQEARCGLCFVSKYSEDPQARGADIENINVTNVVMHARMPFHISTGGHSRGTIRNLAFSHIRAHGHKCSWLVGLADNPVRGLSFHDVEVTISAGAEFMEVGGEGYPDPRREWYKGYPAAFYCEHVEDLTFRELRLRWEELDAPWRHALWLRHVRDVRVDGLRCDNTPALVAGEAIRAEHAADLRLDRVWYR